MENQKTINIENYLNSLDLSKEEKIELFYKISGCNDDEVSLIWEKDKIAGVVQLDKIKELNVQVEVK